MNDELALVSYSMKLLFVVITTPIGASEIVYS